MNEEPSLSIPYPLDPEMIAAYRDDGVVLIPNFIDREVASRCATVLEEAFYRHCGPLRDVEQLDAYGRAFVQLVNLSQREPAVAAFTHARRFAETAARLMGVRGVRIFVEDFLFKLAGRYPTAWHQDGSVLPVATDKMCTMWLPLSDVTPDMGTLRFALGSHHAGIQSPVDISEESERWFAQYIQEEALEILESGTQSLGFASFHDGASVHGAGSNTTDRDRNAVAIHYFDSDARIIEPRNPSHTHLLELFAPGKKAGDSADVPAWPEVWRDTQA